MKFLKFLWNKIIAFWCLCPKCYKYLHVSDFPDQLEKNKLYLLGKPDAEWLASMACPCGCGDAIELVLLDAEYPSWKLSKNTDQRIPTLRPSVWRTKGCKSHFFLRNGLIEWCNS